MKKLTSLLVALMLALSVANGFASEYKGKSIKAKLASEEIEGDFMTVWARNFASHMKEWSGGKIEIEVYPYGTLGENGDINELCQLGVVQFVFSDYAWISAFVPQAQVLALNYLFPTENISETLDWIVKKGEFMPLLEKNFRKNGMVPLSVMFEGWQWIGSKKPILKMADLKGQKIRVMASKLLVEDYKAYGTSPTPMNYGEIYSGLQMGLIDAQVQPLFAHYSMKFYEVENYITQIGNEPFLGIPTVNQEFFDALTPEAQQEMRNFWINAIIPAGKWIEKKNKEDKAKMQKANPKLKFETLEGEVLEEFKAAAKTVYPEFVNIGGEGSQEILDALLKDVKSAKDAVK
jgi:TRAP-type C4-dicarboxylate transport system substrate-binding protein